MDDRYDFENFEEDNEKFLTCSERQYLIKNMLEHVVCDDENIKHVVGYHKIRVYKGRPISKCYTPSRPNNNFKVYATILSETIFFKDAKGTISSSTPHLKSEIIEFIKMVQIRQRGDGGSLVS